MSLRVVAAPIGAVVGFAIGGPAGAAWGWQIGATAGAILDPQTIKGPSLGDIAAQTSQEGGPIPIVYGISSPIAGNIISCSPPRIETVKSGGKGGPKVETEVVYRTYAIGICEGPIGGVLRVWRNNTKVYDALDPEFTAPQSDVSEIPGWAGGGEVAAEVPSRNAAFLEKARFFLGTYDQNASPDLEAIHGAGTTPAYRGLAYMVMADEDVTDVGGMVPQWLFQISRAGLPAKKLDVFMPLGSAAPGWNQTWVKPAGVDAVDVLIVGTGGPSRVTNQTSLDSNASGGGGGGQVRWVENVSVTEDVTVIVPDPTLGQAATATLLVSFGSLTAQPGGGWHVVLNPEKADGASGAGGAVNRTGSNNIVYPPGVSTIGQGAGGVAVVTGNGANDDAYGGGGGGAGGNGQDAVIGKGGDGGIGVYMGHLVGDDLGDDGWFGGGGGGGHGYDIPGAVAGSGGKGGGGQGANGFDGPASPGMPGTGGGAGGVSSTDPPDAEARGGGGIVVVLYDDPNPPTPPLQQLPSVVSSLCERAGLSPDEIDVSLLDTEVIVHGITVTNQYAASQAIQSLGQVYRFDATKYDGKIRFVPRGGNSVATITEDEMVDESDAPIDANTKRSDAIAIPRVLNLSYYDIDSSGLTPIKQTSERSGDRRAVGDASMQSAVVMDADTAGQAVHIAHAVMIEEQKGELRFALPDSHIKLVPSDPVIVQWQGKSERCRLNQVEILDGYQRYVALRDRQSSYTSDVEGLPPPVIPTPPSRVPGPTVVIPLDIPIVQDADDSVGLSYYVAVCGLTEGWTGAVVELSYDGGANYTQSKSAAIPSIIGKLTTPLPDHPADYPDETNEFTVELFSPGVELADTDLAGMMNRINLAAVGNFEDGWELINFADATEDDPELRHWSVSNLLRGRRGTPTRAHAVDEVVVLLDRNLVAMESANITDIGKTLTFRATSNGATTDTGTVVSVDYSGWSQKERKPAYLVTERDVNDLHATWQGVGRMGGGASAMHGLYFSGYRLTAFDQSNASVSLDTSSLSATVDVSSLTDPVMAIVQQLNSLTGPSLPVYSQSSALDSDIQRMSEWSVFSVYEGSFIAGKISTTSGQNEMFYSSDAESWTNVPSGQNNLFARPFSILNVGGDWYVKDNQSATSTRFGKKSGGDWHTGEYDWEVVTDLPNISFFGGVPTTDDFVYDGEKFVAIVPGVATFHQPIFITSDDGLTWEDVPIDIEAYDLPGGETYSLHWDGNGDRWLLFMDMAGTYPNRYGEKRLYQCDADDNFAVWTEISSFRSAFGATTGAGVGRMYVHRLNDSSGDTYVVVTKETDGWVSMKSVDGGDTWTKHAIPVPTIGGGADALHVPSGLVWDGANYITSGRGLIMRSADGETWMHQSITPSPNAPPLPYYALWSNENGVLLRNHASLIVGYSQEILRRSDDSGTTWTFAYSP